MLILVMKFRIRPNIKLIILFIKVYLVIGMRCACTDCQVEECTDAQCIEEQQELLDSKKLKYFRQGKSLDDLTTEKCLELDD